MMTFAVGDMVRLPVPSRGWFGRLLERHGWLKPRSGNYVVTAVTSWGARIEAEK